MKRPQDRPSPGTIPGLLLPRRAWKALAKEGVRSLAELVAVAERLHILPGIGCKTAQLIRAEIVRLHLRDRGRDLGTP